MKKINITGLLIFVSLISYAQPAGYAWIAEFDNNFGSTRIFELNTPVNDIHRLFIQANSNDDQYVIEWNSFADKWQNTSTPKNQVFTLFHGGNGSPDGVITSGAESGKYYTIQIQGLAYSDRQAVFMETTNAPIEILSISGNYSGPGNPLTVQVTLSDIKSSEENIFIRYTNDGFASSSFVLMNCIGTDCEGTIPGEDVNEGAENNLYILSTTLSSSDISHSNADLVTLFLLNNSGLNYRMDEAPLPVTFAQFTATHRTSEVLLT